MDKEWKEMKVDEKLESLKEWCQRTHDSINHVANRLRVVESDIQKILKTFPKG